MQPSVQSSFNRLLDIRTRASSVTQQEAKRTTTMPGLGRSWAAAWAPLVAVVASLAGLRVMHHRPMHVTTAKNASAVLTTRQTVFPVHDQINSLIDMYAPFWNSCSPLLELGETRRVHPDGDVWWITEDLGGPGGNPDPERWDLVLTGQKALEICLSPLMGSRVSRNGRAAARLPRLCETLQIRLAHTRAAQAHIASLLAGPPGSTLWLDRVQYRFFGLFYTLESISADGGVSANASVLPEFAANEERRRTAGALHRHIAEGGPWHSINKQMRRTLLQFRQNCSSIAGYLETLYEHYDESIIDLAGLGRDAASRPGALELFPPIHAPVMHIESMISAVDSYIAALDTVGKRRTFPLATTL